MKLAKISEYLRIYSEILFFAFSFVVIKLCLKGVWVLIINSQTVLVVLLIMSSQKRSKKKKPTLTPIASMDHDEKYYYIQVELPGVRKQDVELSVSDQSFCVRAPREDAEFLGCYVLAHLSDTDKTRAKFENGLLSMEIPLKKPQKEKRVIVE